MKVTNTNDDKSWNHEFLVKVVNTNHLDMSRCLRQSPWQVCDEPVCVTLMEFSPFHYSMGKVGDKVRSQTQITKVSDTICVAKFHDLCLQLFPWESFSESCKVSVMEFGLNQSTIYVQIKPARSNLSMHNASQWHSSQPFTVQNQNYKHLTQVRNALHAKLNHQVQTSR